MTARPFVHGITWASEIDNKTGRPVESPTAYEGLKPVLVSPSSDGAHNWYPMAMHPGTGLGLRADARWIRHAACSRKNLEVQSRKLEQRRDPRLCRPAHR